MHDETTHFCYSLAGSIKRPCKEQREGDNSGEEYFGDAETSSSDSEKEVYFSKENLKRDFDKGKREYFLASLGQIAQNVAAVCNPLFCHKSVKYDGPGECSPEKDRL